MLSGVFISVVSEYADCNADLAVVCGRRVETRYGCPESFSPSHIKHQGQRLVLPERNITELEVLSCGFSEDGYRSRIVFIVCFPDEDYLLADFKVRPR